MKKQSNMRAAARGQDSKKHRSAPRAPKPLIFHSLAAAYPMIEGADYAALIADIRKHGLREPLILYQGKILDGRNRYRACNEAGVDLQYREIAFIDDDDAAAFVDSVNLHRRHLTPEQKNDRVAARLKADPTQSDRQVAEQTGASHPYVAKVRRALEESGDVETVSTSTDTKGRTQPRQRSKPTKTKPTKTKAAKTKSAKAKSVAGAGAASPTTEPPQHPAPMAGAAKPNGQPPASDVGPYSAGEHDRLRARVDELNAANQQLQIKIGGLESEVAELKDRNAELEARITAFGAEQVKASIPDDLSIPQFMQRSAS